MWELDYKESWAQKNWCFWTVVLDKTLESPLNCKDIKPVNPKENQPWILIGRTDGEAEVHTEDVGLKDVKQELGPGDITMKSSLYRVILRAGLYGCLCQ